MSRELTTPSDAVNRAATIAALLALLMNGVNGEYETPDPMHMFELLAAIVGIAGVLTRWQWAGTFGLLVVLISGLHEFAIQGDHRASDSLLATNEAVGALLSGVDPYGHVYASTNPPGGGLGYPSGEIVWYTLMHLLHVNLFRVDLICGILSLGLIGALAPFCGSGLASLGISLIGWNGFITFRLTDGSNDNSVLFLVLSGFSALVWSRASSGRGAAFLWWASAVAFGWALAFKEYSLPVVIFVALFLWRENGQRARSWVYAVVGTVAVLILPFFVWNPAAFVQDIIKGPLYHTNFWGRNVWHDFVHPLLPADPLGSFVPIIGLLVVLALGTILWRRPARSLGVALFQGTLVVTAILVLTRWTTFPYYVFLTPLVIVAAIMTLGDDYALASTD
jgi:hypothetical protein